MPTFKYRAVNSSGKSTKGSVYARSLLDAKKKIQISGLTPVKIEKENEFIVRLNSLASQKISLKNVSVFCRQLYIIVNSGVSILSGLGVLKKQTKNKAMRNVIKRIHNEVQKGRSLSEAMLDVEIMLPPLLVNMVAVGEVSGNLAEILDRMAEYYDKEGYIREKIKGAMIYPTILMVLAMIMLVFFANFVMPEIVGVITEVGGNLPANTLFIINSVNFLKEYFIEIFIGLGCLIAILVFASKRESLRYVRDKAIMRLPMISTSIRNITTARFVRTLSLLLKGGVPLLQVLDTTRKIMGNAVLESSIKDAMEGVKRGEGLATNIAASNFFDPMVIHMIEMGEEMGELDDILETMANFYDKEAEAWLLKMMALVEPIFTIVVGLLIGFIIISLMMPMFGMLSQLSQ